MAKFSTPVMVVLALAILAVVATVAGLGGVAYMSYRNRLAADETRAKLAALDAALEQYRTLAADPATQGGQAAGAAKSRAARSRTKTTAKAGSGDADAPQQDAGEGQGDEVRVIQNGDGGAVVTQTGPGQFHMTFTGPTGGSSRTLMGMMVPVAGRVKSMPLDDGQRAAIQTFEQAFEATAGPRYEQAGNAMSAAFTALRAAQESKDERLINAAMDQLREASKQQMETVQELNRQYLDGVRPYLNEEQVKELQRLVDRGPGRASGFVSVQVNEEKPTVTVIQAEAGDGAGEAPAEAPQP